MLQGGKRTRNITPEASSEAPLVSVITVVYNGAETLEKCMLSVFEQSYSSVEYIVVDGGSKDGTTALLEKHDAKIDYWVSEPDKGIYNAMNKGLALATGEIISILNADDRYLPDTLTQVVSKFKVSSCDIVYGNTKKVKVIDGQEYGDILRPNFDLMPRNMGLIHPSTFLRRKVYDEVGNFNETYKISADYDLLLRVYLKNYQFEYLDETLTVFAVGGASNLSCQSYVEGYEIVKSHGTGHHEGMKVLLRKCQRKSRLKKIINTFAKVLFLGPFLERRIEKKWMNKQA